VLAPAVTEPPAEASIVLGPGLLLDVDLFQEAQSQIQSYTGVRPLTLTVTVTKGTLIGSSIASQALDTGALPAGSTVKLINNGVILGKGGTGGDSSGTAATSQGTAGGTAIKLQVPTTLDNANGTIMGGGGGGGGAVTIELNSGGGGGGGGGFPAGLGGAGSANNGQPGTSDFPGFGGAGDMTLNPPFGYSPNSSPDKALFNPRSGGIGGAPGFPGGHYDGVLPIAGRTGGAPGALVEGGQFLSWEQQRYGTAQGHVLNFAGGIAEIFVGKIVAAFDTVEYLAAAGWNGVAPLAVTIRILPEAVIYTPRRYKWEADFTHIYADAAIRISDLPAGSNIIVINAGRIYGYAGWGGRGGRSVDTLATATFAHDPMSGEDGGTAILSAVSAAGFSIDNANGSIRGGGGGGGGGAGGAGVPAASIRIERGGVGGAGQGPLPVPGMLPVPSSFRTVEFPTTGTFEHAHYDLNVDGTANVLGLTNFPAYQLSTQAVKAVNSRESSPGDGGQGWHNQPAETPLQRFGGKGGVWGAPGEAGHGSDNLAGSQAHQPGGVAGLAIQGPHTLLSAGEILGAVV